MQAKTESSNTLKAAIMEARQLAASMFQAANLSWSARQDLSNIFASDRLFRCFVNEDMLEPIISAADNRTIAARLNLQAFKQSKEVDPHTESFVAYHSYRGKVIQVFAEAIRAHREMREEGSVEVVRAETVANEDYSVITVNGRDYHLTTAQRAVLKIIWDRKRHTQNNILDAMEGSAGAGYGRVDKIFLKPQRPDGKDFWKQFVRKDGQGAIRLTLP